MMFKIPLGPPNLFRRFRYIPAFPAVSLHKELVLPDYSTPRVRRYRAHFNGDHYDCRIERCPAALAAYSERMWRIYARTMMAEAAAQGLDPCRLALDKLPVELSSSDDDEPDVIDWLSARAGVKSLLLSGNPPGPEPEPEPVVIYKRAPKPEPFVRSEGW